MGGKRYHTPYYRKSFRPSLSPSGSTSRADSLFARRHRIGGHSGGRPTRSSRIQWRDKEHDECGVTLHHDESGDPCQDHLLPERQACASIVSLIMKPETFFERWRGGRARIWEYQVSHKMLTIRVEIEGRRGNLHIRCSDTSFIHG